MSLLILATPDVPNNYHYCDPYITASPTHEVYYWHRILYNHLS